MADNTFFGRLRRLFSTQTVVRNVGGKKIKVVDTDRSQAYKGATNFLTDRYGDFILLKPPLKMSTLALWFMPFIFLIIGIFIIFLNNKRSKKIIE